MNIDTDFEADAAMIACSNAVAEALAELKVTHYARLLFACIQAEAAYVAALLIATKTYKPHTVARSMAEAMATALTMEVKNPKIIYTDSSTTGSKQ